MAFSLGSIFVELTCNAAKFLSGMDKASVAAKKTGKDIRSGLGEVGGSLAVFGETGNRIGAVLQSVGNQAAGAFDVAANKGRGFGTLMAGSVLAGVTGLAGGMFALAMHAAEVGSKIFEASEKTGIGAAQLSGLMAITKATGGDFEGLSTALARAGANLTKAIIEPGAVTSKILAQVMGGAKQLSDLGLKPMGDRLQIVLAHIFALNNVGERNAALSSLLGRGWMENVTSLKLLAEQGYGPAIAQARKFGIFFDDNSSRQARQFTVALAELKAQTASLGLEIGKSLIPLLKQEMVGLQGTGSYAKTAAAALYKLGAIALAVASGGTAIMGAAHMWKEGNKILDENAQKQTDYLVTLDNLTEGQKASADSTGKLTGETKKYTDVLASIVGRERDELDSLATLGNKQREAQLEYDRTTREIQKQIDAGGNYAEGVKAMGLAWDIYRVKYIAAMQESVKVPHGPGVPFAPSGPPALETPGAGVTARYFGPSAIGGAMPQMNSTLSQLAALGGEMDSTRGKEKSLREETELSDASFRRLAAAFPGLTEGEVAATAAGRKMIEQLTKLDQLGTASERFTEFKNQIIDDGNDVAGHLIQTMGGALNQLEDSFAKLAVTGRANFKQIYQGMEESLIKTGLQKGVSSLLGHFGIAAAGGKPDGSSGNPLWVKMAGGPNGGGLASLPFPGQRSGDDAGSAQSGSGLSGMFQGVAKGIGSIGSFFSSVFGGFLEGGGDVTPGKAYMVGEKHPELFVPHASGAVVPSLAAQTLRPLSYAPTYNINTPNPDAFRRSQAQIMAEGYRAMAQTHQRNS